MKYPDDTITPENRSLGKKYRSVDNVLTSAHSQSHQNPYKLEVGSTVQYGKPPEYGVIKWIGKIPGSEKILHAGVEMVSYSTNIFYKYVRLNFCVYIYNNFYLNSLCTYIHMYVSVIVVMQSHN